MTSSEASGRIERILGRIGRLAVHHTLWIFIISVLFALGGAVADRYLPTNTDYEELIPQDTPELVYIRELREITGSGGVLRFMIEADDITSPEILTWLDEYFKETEQETILEFRLEYVNSGSSKYILELLRRLRKLVRKGKKVKIIWCFETDDESIEDLGEHYKHTVDLPIEIREVDEID